MEHIRTILEIYAIACMVLSPVVLAAAVVIYKKTSFFDRLDERLDRWLGLDKKPVKGTEKKEGTDAGKEETKKEEQKPLERFRIMIGEDYWCTGMIDARMDMASWSSEDAFVGEIDEKLKFHADKAGVARIKKDGIAAFEIEVMPTEAFLADTDIKDILAGAVIEKVIERMKGFRLTNAGTGESPISYHIGQNGLESVSFAKREGRLTGVIYRFSTDDTDIEDAALSAMDERFARVACRGDIEIWYHENMKRDADLVAFMRKDEDGVTMLGIGTPWRSGASANEVLRNISMVERRFTSLTGGLKPVDTAYDGEDRDRLFATLGPEVSESTSSRYGTDDEVPEKDAYFEDNRPETSELPDDMDKEAARPAVPEDAETADPAPAAENIPETGTEGTGTADRGNPSESISEEISEDITGDDGGETMPEEPEGDAQDSFFDEGGDSMEIPEMNEDN